MDRYSGVRRTENGEAWMASSEASRGCIRKLSADGAGAADEKYPCLRLVLGWERLPNHVRPGSF